MKFDLEFVVKLLVIIGGLNWLLVGAINLDLVQTIFGSIPMLAQAVYIIVGLCALYMLYMMFTEK